MPDDPNYYSKRRPGLMPDESDDIPAPYSEGPIWKKHASRLLGSLHLLREQKADTQLGTPEVSPTQSEIETPVSVGGGESKG